MSAGPIVWVLCSEIQPLKSREFGIACSTMTNWITCAIVGATFLSLVDTLGSAHTFWLYAFLNGFFIVLTMVKFYEKFMGNRLFEGVMGWLRPAVVGLIGAAAVILMVDTSWTGLIPHFAIVEENFMDWKSWALFAAAMVASLGFKVNPIYIIIAGGIAGLLLY